MAQRMAVERMNGYFYKIREPSSLHQRQDEFVPCETGSAYEIEMPERGFLPRPRETTRRIQQEEAIGLKDLRLFTG
jgi:hypothetical protein